MARLKLTLQERAKVAHTVYDNMFERGWMLAIEQWWILIISQIVLTFQMMCCMTPDLKGLERGYQGNCFCRTHILSLFFLMLLVTDQSSSESGYKNEKMSIKKNLRTLSVWILPYNWFVCLEHTKHKNKLYICHLHEDLVNSTFVPCQKTTHIFYDVMLRGVAW